MDLHLSEATTSTTTTTTTAICVFLWAGFVLVEEQLSQQENHSEQINELMEGFKNDASQSTDRWGRGVLKMTSIIHMKYFNCFYTDDLHKCFGFFLTAGAHTNRREAAVIERSCVATAAPVAGGDILFFSDGEAQRSRFESRASSMNSTLKRVNV